MMINNMNRPDQVRYLLTEFSTQHLNDELMNYTLNLFDMLERKKDISNSRGKTEIWAAAIVYVIARLNFLFDRDNAYFLSSDTIFDFFHTKKSTVSNKANEIEKNYKIGFGTKGLCSKGISDSLTLIQLPGGFVIPKNALRPPQDCGWLC